MTATDRDQPVLVTSINPASRRWAAPQVSGMMLGTGGDTESVTGPVSRRNTLGIAACLLTCAAALIFALALPWLSTVLLALLTPITIGVQRNMVQLTQWCWRPIKTGSLARSYSRAGLLYSYPLAAALAMLWMFTLVLVNSAWAALIYLSGPDLVIGQVALLIWVASAIWATWAIIGGWSSKSTVCDRCRARLLWRKHHWQAAADPAGDHPPVRCHHGAPHAPLVLPDELTGGQLHTLSDRHSRPVALPPS